MNEKKRLHTAYNQVENLIKLLEENEWKTFLYKNLIPVKYELKRHLSSLKNLDKE